MLNEQSRRKLGKLKIDTKAGVWTLAAEPHVIMKAKRVFEKIDKGQFGAVTIKDQPEVCHDLDWFLQRYDLEMDDFTLGYLRSQSRAYVRNLAEMEKVLAPDYQARTFPMALQPRGYQKSAAELYLKQGSLLLADQIGTGKTCIGITTFTDKRTLPALVCCPPIIQKQWANEIERFIPGTFTHIIKTQANYTLPTRDGRSPDVLIISYPKLAHWADFLRGYCRSAWFDEVHELRRPESHKYKAAVHLCRDLKFKCGASGSPVMNYGGEMFNVLNLLKEGCLGTEEEFSREWCSYDNHNGKKIIGDPRALGTYLRENFLMLRRTREDIGRELPAVQVIPHVLEIDPDRIERATVGAARFAEIVLSHTAKGMDKMNAGAQLTNMLRHATGVAKADGIANFARMIVDNGENAIMYLWHRAVYEIIRENFDNHNNGRVPYAMFTGSETPNQKEAAKNRFLTGDAKILLMSLRSGQGIDGLQNATSTVVLAELDWSEGCMNQCIGRVLREGQEKQVNAYYLVGNDGSDPLMAEVLGLKKQQAQGIHDPHKEFIEELQVDPDHVKRLAEQFLAKMRR